VTTDFGERFLTGLPDIKHYSAIGIGPGIEKHIDTYEVISQLVSRYNKPIVFDADALNIMATEKSFLKMLPEGSILTPHPGEFKRLAGFWNDDFKKLEQQIAMSEEYKVFIVLKGANTSISTPEGKIYFNSTGNPGMATGGSGDVLTGMITSFLGQGYVPREAAILGVYLHGLAGDIGSSNIGEESGARKAEQITISDGSHIQVSNIRASSESTITKIRIYCSTPNGQTLYLVGEIPNSDGSFTIGDVHTTGVTPLKSFNMYPAPKGDIIRYFKGRSF